MTNLLKHRCPFSRKDRRVALIQLDGVITEGKAVPGDASVLDLLKQVESEKFKSLVLRINSPGGTVGASQELYEVISRLSQEKNIKVVVSMGDVAASGGVYVAMAADYIYAQPGTVTGSIGVIIKSGNLQGLLQKLGIGSDVVKSGKFKDILSMDRGLTDEEKQLLQGIIDDTYEQFVEIVAKKAKLSIDQVKAFADGRIMSGRQALNSGFVDGLGGLHEAMEKARALAGQDLTLKPKLVVLGKKKPFWKRFLKGSFMQRADQALSLVESGLFGGVPLWLMPYHG